MQWAGGMLLPVLGGGVGGGARSCVLHGLVKSGPTELDFAVIIAAPKWKRVGDKCLVQLGLV